MLPFSLWWRWIIEKDDWTNGQLINCTQAGTQRRFISTFRSSVSCTVDIDLSGWIGELVKCNISRLQGFDCAKFNWPFAGTSRDVASHPDLWWFKKWLKMSCPDSPSEFQPGVDQQQHTASEWLNTMYMFIYIYIYIDQSIPDLYI